MPKNNPLSFTRTISVLLLFFLLLGTVGCVKKPAGNTAEPRTDGPTPEAGTVEPTAEAAATEPTATDDADSQIEAWLIDEGYKVANRIGAVHGITFQKENCECSINGFFASLSFFDSDNKLRILMITDSLENGEFSIPSGQIGIFATDTSDNAELDIPRWRAEFGGHVLTVTADEVRASGCSAEEGSEAFELAAYTCYAEQLKAQYLEAPEGSPMRCIEARLIKCEPDENLRTDGSYIIWIAVRPDNVISFDRYLDYSSFIYTEPEHPELYGWYVICGACKLAENSPGVFSAPVALNTGT